MKSNDSESNVPPFAQNSNSENSSAAEGVEKASFQVKQRYIVAAMRHKKGGPVPVFTRDFRVYREYAGEDQEGYRQIIEVDPKTKVCTKVSLATVSIAIARHLEWLKGFCFTDQQIDATARLWLKLIDESAEPKPFLFKGEKGHFKGTNNELCFRRVPWDPDSSVPHLKWRELFSPSDVKNYKGMMAFIGSIFFFESYNQQFLVIKGEGGDGKGSLIRFLERVMGSNPVRVITRTPTDDNKHAGTYFSGGKRVIAFADLRRQAFLHSDLVMAASGNDTIYVDPKGREGFNDKLNVKIIAMINGPMVIPGQRSYRRRYIPVEMPFQDATDMRLDSSIEETLWAEGAGFIGEAIETFLEACPNRTEMIQVPQEIWDHFDKNPATEEEAEIESIFNEHFDVQPPQTPKHHQFYVSSTTFRADFLDREWGKKRSFHVAVKKWLKNKHGIEECQRWCPSEQRNMGRVYYRLMLKS